MECDIELINALIIFATLSLVTRRVGELWGVLRVMGVPGGRKSVGGVEGFVLKLDFLKFKNVNFLVIFACALFRRDVVGKDRK